MILIVLPLSSVDNFSEVIKSTSTFIEHLMVFEFIRWRKMLIGGGLNIPLSVEPEVIFSGVEMFLYLLDLELLFSLHKELYLQVCLLQLFLGSLVFRLKFLELVSGYAVTEKLWGLNFDILVLLLHLVRLGISLEADTSEVEEPFWLLHLLVLYWLGAPLAIGMNNAPIFLVDLNLLILELVVITEQLLVLFPLLIDLLLTIQPRSSQFFVEFSG